MKKQKARRLIIFVALVAVASLVLVGCPDEKDESVSIEERVNAFMSDVNARRLGSLQQHIHPDAGQYGASNDPDTWDPPFSSGVNYVLSARSTTDSTHNATISGGVFGTGESIAFVMREHGSKIWKILRINNAALTFQSVD